MLIGIDLDNTIVCYDGVFHQVARNSGQLPDGVGESKSEVREYLCSQGKESLWTELQGSVYGVHMGAARPFPGVKEFLGRAAQAGTAVHVISHRTLHPYVGEKHDLHRAARDWLSIWGFHDPKGLALPRDHVHLEATRAAKLERIRAVGCTIFIDDLPEVLSDPAFPPRVRRVLFDPAGQLQDSPSWRRARSWAELGAWLGKEWG